MPGGGFDVAKRYDRGQEAPGLRALRRRAGLTQEELAARAGVHVGTVRRLETDHRGDYSKLNALARALARELGEEVTLRMLITPSPTTP